MNLNPWCAPDGTEYGVPLGLAKSLTVALATAGVMSIEAKEDQWIVAVNWALIDPAGAAVQAANLTSIQAGGDLLWDDQSPAGQSLLFPAVTQLTPEKILGSRRPFLLSASQKLQFSVNNASGVAIRFSAVLESYRRTLIPAVGGRLKR